MTEHHPSLAPTRKLPLAPLTTLHLGGCAEHAFELVDPDHVPDLGQVIAATGSPPDEWPVPIGGGSNVLVADSGVTAPVILVRTRGVTYHRPEADGPVLVTAQAGHPWPELVRELIDQGLVGMEMMTGIPGTVGAMPVQNVGAYGQETADRLAWVDVWDWRLGRPIRLSAEDCRLMHRDSLFKRNRRWLILSVTFAFPRGSVSAPVTYREVAEVLDVPVGARVPAGDAAAAVEKVRAGKGMLLDDSCPDGRNVGSVFLSPLISTERAARLSAERAPVHDFADGSTRVSASWLMRDAGLTLGEFVQPGVRVSTRHYTLVADDTAGHKATVGSFVDAARQVQERVVEATGVWLAPEPDPIGELPAYQQLIDRAGNKAATS